MLKEIPLSPTMSVFQAATEKKARGERVYNFSAGDPVIPNHPAIQEMTQERARSGLVPYPPVEGIRELREALCAWVNAACGMDYKADEVAVTCGGKFALYAILACYLSAGDEILLIAPYYVTYPGIAALLGAGVKTILASAEKGWKISAADLEGAATTKTKFLILNNACNPTGALYTENELRELLAAAKKLGLTVISDEVYSGLTYEPKTPFISCGRFPEYRENLFIVQSCSKNFAMSGWRVGFILANTAKLGRIKAFQHQTTSGVSLISQWGALGALKQGETVNRYVKAILQKRLFLFTDTFSSLFHQKIERPSSAIYAFVPLSALGAPALMSAPELSNLLIKHGNIATVPGEAFGTPGYLRFACSENEQEIVEGVTHLHKIMCSL